MNEKFKIAVPVVFTLASVCLFLEAGLVSTPANDALADRLQATAQRLEDSIAKGTLPSEQALEALRARRDAMVRARAEYGALDPRDTGDDLPALLREWGYQPDDPVALSLKELQSELAGLLGPERKSEADAFVGDMVRKIGQADLFTSLTLGVSRDLSPAGTGPPGSLHPFRVVFSFVSGVGEAAEFIETWALEAPDGILLRPEKISLKRIEPDLWGSSLKFYSSPPIRVDLSYLILLNVGNQ